MHASHSDIAQPVRRHSRLVMVCLLGLASLVTACMPSNPVAPDGASPRNLPVGSYYLRTVDGQGLPLSMPGGLRIESGFLMSDSASAELVGFGESIRRETTASVSLATGRAQVIGQDYRSGRIAAVTWAANGAGARADSVFWSVDSVIVYRTGAGPSIAGPGHRLVYTRAIAADTL